MEDERKCIECGEKLRGRIDKKFCSDQCRSSFFNRQNAASTKLIRNINAILRKNRTILHDLNPSGKTSMPKKRLIEAGFNFDYFTNIYVTKNNTTYYFCYDQGYLLNNKGYVTIVVKKSYV